MDDGCNAKRRRRSAGTTDPGAADPMILPLAKSNIQEHRSQITACCSDRHAQPLKYTIQQRNINESFGPIYTKEMGREDTLLC
jgi:hypothetical protein